MENLEIYQDISKRTDGDIYVGVVGPVRTGKSTFIKRFMDLLVIPNIENTYKLVDKYSHAHEIKLISNQPDLLEKVVYKFDPDYIFFPH